MRSGTQDAADTDLRRRVEHAEILARAGKHGEAKALVPASPAEAPRDVVILHKSGVVWRYCQDADRAAAFFREALKVHPGFAYTEAEMAGLFGDADRREDALTWYRKAIADDPTFALPYLRAAQLERFFHRNHEGVSLLRAACAAIPDDKHLQRAYAEALVYQGLRREALPLRERLARATPVEWDDQCSYATSASELQEFSAVIALVEGLGETIPANYYIVLGSLLANARLFFHCKQMETAGVSKEDGQWVPPEGVIARLACAIHAGQPLSLIRLGDGEARFLAYMAGAEATGLGERERLAMGDSIWFNWFASSLTAAPTEDLHDVTARLKHSLISCDILGVPNGERIGHDGRHAGFLRFQDSLLRREVYPQREANVLTNAFVHFELHKLDPFFGNLLRGLPFLGAVGPHHDLAARLGSWLGIGETRDYIVPGEGCLPERQGYVRGSGHFPERYRELIDTLEVPRPGSVFLVAAGLLGKIYCGLIRERGGIAIDIGSLADAWMGYDTRPGSFQIGPEWTLSSGSAV